MTAPVSASPARGFDPDPGCLICGGMGVRHAQRKNDRGFFVGRDACPCTILGPLGTPDASPARDVPASYRRDLSELPPIKDTAVLDAYPDCQPRTPIDPVAKILSPGLQRGNTDLQPATRGHVPEYRDCAVCGGRGVVGSAFPDRSGHRQCMGCKGAGRVKR